MCLLAYMVSSSVCDEGLDYPLALCTFHRQNEDLGTLKDTHSP